MPVELSCSALPNSWKQTLSPNTNIWQEHVDFWDCSLKKTPMPVIVFHGTYRIFWSLIRQLFINAFHWDKNVFSAMPQSDSCRCCGPSQHLLISIFKLLLHPLNCGNKGEGVFMDQSDIRSCLWLLKHYKSWKTWAQQPCHDGSDSSKLHMRHRDFMLLLSGTWNFGIASRRVVDYLYNPTEKQGRAGDVWIHL